jgi:hypothetical protein
VAHPGTWSVRTALPYGLNTRTDWSGAKKCPATGKNRVLRPNRSILAYVEPDAVLNPPDMHAWISAQCSSPVSGGPQVCCEAITIGVRNRARMSLPDTITSLLVPDLPVYLYWRSFGIADRDLIERMARFSRLLIVDSHRSREDLRNRLQILQLLADQPAGISMRDLHWARITTWRVTGAPATGAIPDPLRPESARSLPRSGA